MRTRYAVPALLSVAVLSTACSSGSSTGATASSFTPGAATTAAVGAASGAATTPATSAPVPTAAVTSTAPTSAAPTTTSAAPTSSAPVSDVAKQVDKGNISMAGRKATLSYTAVVTSDAEKNAVLTDFGDFERTFMITLDGHSLTDPLITTYTGGQEETQLKQSIAQFTKAQQVSRGVLRYWDAKVTEIHTVTGGRVATVTSCGNESKWIGVDQKTGKDVPNDPEDKYSYLQTSFLYNNGSGHWRVTLVNPAVYQAKACAK